MNQEQHLLRAWSHNHRITTAFAILSMPTYLYETIPSNGSIGERFEWRQSMNDAPLAKHPETGVPVRRVISGGLGYLSATEKSSPEQGPGCGPATCRCGRFD